MKKLLFLCVLGLLTLSACADSPGPELSSLPEDWNVQKARAEGVEVPNEEKNIQIPEDNSGNQFPSGNYILLKNLPNSNLVEVSLFLNSSKICTWEDPISPPWDYQIPQDNLYFVEDNCSGLGDNIITWYVFNNLGLDSQNGEEFSVWRQTGSQFFLLPNE